MIYLTHLKVFVLREWLLSLFLTNLMKYCALPMM